MTGQEVPFLPSRKNCNLVTCSRTLGPCKPTIIVWSFTSFRQLRHVFSCLVLYRQRGGRTPVLTPKHVLGASLGIGQSQDNPAHCLDIVLTLSWHCPGVSCMPNLFLRRVLRSRERGFIQVKLRLRKVDFVLAVGIWVGFGPELGSEKNSPKIKKSWFFMHSISQI